MGRLKVVIVDDQPMHLMVLSSYFDVHTYEVNMFETPEEALLHAEQNQADVFVIDYFMPHMNGIELIDNIKLIRPESMCILYTSEQIIKKDCIDLVMQKPVIKSVLIDKINQFINIE